MKEQDALKKAFEILKRSDQRELTTNDGKQLLQLESFINENKFGDLWEAFISSASEEALKNSDKEERIIQEIMNKYSVSKWYDKILEALPGIDKGYLLSMIEIENGGDVRAIDEDGNERGVM